MEIIKSIIMIINTLKLWISGPLFLTCPFQKKIYLFIIFGLFCTASAQTNLTPVLGDSEYPIYVDYTGYHTIYPDTNDHADLDMLLQREVELKANNYFYAIGASHYDWDDLHAFLPKAKMAGIKVWVYLLAPSEQPPTAGATLYSEPYRTDYITWAKEIAKLSLRYSNLVGYVIDDFWFDVRENNLFTATYINNMVTTGKFINPNLKFYPLTYSNEVFNPYTTKLSNLFDGMVVAFAQDSLEITKNISLMNSSLHSKAVMSILPFTITNGGDYGKVSQTVNVTVNTDTSLTFHVWAGSYGLATARGVGYHKLQLLIDSTLTTGNNLIPPSSSDFITDGTAYWEPVQSTVAYNSGAQDMQMTYSTGSVWGIARSLALTSGSIYKISFRAKSSNSTRKFFRNGYGGTWTATLNPNLTTTYQNYEATLSGSGSNLVIYVNGGASGETVTIDDIIVREYGNLPIWSADIHDIRDTIVTVNLGTALKGRNSALLSLGLYEASGVWMYPAEIAFLDLIPHGIDLNTELGSKAWVVSNKGSVTTQTTSTNEDKKLPMILMETADTYTYPKRYPDSPTVANRVRRINTVCGFVSRGQVEGMVIYALDKTPGSTIFDALRNVYSSFWK
jgi:hypothetical protein